MKTVTGKVTSSEPVTVSGAASILSDFVSRDTGASQAVGAYLRRATAAFDDLVRLHSKSDRGRHKKQRQSDAPDPENVTERLSTRSVEVSQGPSHDSDRKDSEVYTKKKKGKDSWGICGDSDRRMVNKEKRKVEEKNEGNKEENEKKDGFVSDEVKIEVSVREERGNGEINLGEVVERKKKKKKDKDKKVDSGDFRDEGMEMETRIKEEKSYNEINLIEETEGKKKKKKEKDKKEENGVVIGEEEHGGKVRIKEEEKKSDDFANFRREKGGKSSTGDEKERKKRKSREVEEEIRDESEMQLSKKHKKRRRIEGDN